MSGEVSIPRTVTEKTFPSGKLKFSMMNVPQENWDRAFGKNLIDSSNGKTTVSKTVVLGSNPSQSAK